MADSWNFPGEVRRRRYDPWFLAAWLFLVVIVALGFWVQARTIHSLHDTQARQDAIIVYLKDQQQRNGAALCAVLQPDQLDRYGLTCP